MEDPESYHVLNLDRGAGMYGRQCVVIRVTPPVILSLSTYTQYVQKKKAK
jgi:hypothetical protein